MRAARTCRCSTIPLSSGTNPYSRSGRARPCGGESGARRILGRPAFNARDLDRLTALLLDHAIVEVFGASTIYGAPRARTTVLTGMLFGSVRMAAPADGGRGDGIWELRFAQGVQPEPARLELRLHRGEPLLLSWYAHRDGEFVREVARVELSSDGDSRSGPACRRRAAARRPARLRDPPDLG